MARAAFPEGCLAVRVRDVLGPVFTDAEFAGLFPVRGRPAASPGRLAMVLVLQFAEGMSDRQAAHAVRSRIDWKYALGLELTDPGFDFSLLSEFRGRLIAGGVEAGVLDAVLESVSAAGLIKAGGRQRSDATHVLAAVREVNRLESVVETVRAALNALAVAAPGWLAERTPPEWFDRYSARPEDTKFPSRWAARLSHAEQVGQDGMTLLQAVWSGDAPAWLRELPVVEFLRQMWVQEYQVSDGEVGWRKPKDCPPGRLRIRSTYDSDARNGAKRDRAWCGYKVHLTETCEPDAPHLITEVITTTAATADIQVTDQIHDGLARRDLLPDVHLVDAGYIDAAHLVAARRDHGIELVGPVGANTGWQGRREQRSQHRRLHRRLGQQAGDLPERQDQQPVAARRATLVRPRDPSPLLTCGLPPLPLTRPVHPRRHLHGTRDHPAAPRRTRSSPHSPARPANRSMEAALRTPGRHRGHHLPGRPRVRAS